MHKLVTIVGGGVAGLTLGLGLRQRGVPVTVWEAGRYPRHRVCGEFISGTGQHVLGRLGLLSGLQDEGARLAVSAALYAGRNRVAARRLPESAWCISRFVLDDWLAREFEQLGGELRLGARWVEPCGEGVVRASGRRVEPATGGWRLFGLKVHAHAVALEADLEMHLVPAGYVGLCRLGGCEVNICGFFRTAATVPDLAQRWRDWLGGPAGSALRSRLSGAQLREDSFCSVAGLSLRPNHATQRKECCVGDALTMIPPVTGNGMSMALESAELAIEPLAQFSRGKLQWSAVEQEIACSCAARFAARLRWAAWVQRALFHPAARPALLFLVARSGWLWRQLFERTR